MARFTIRVVLHGATSSQYDDLHEQMRLYGAARHITGDDGITYDLPDGEYNLIRDQSLTTVRDDTCAIADSIRPGASVLVTEGFRSWRLRPVPGDS